MPRSSISDATAARSTPARGKYFAKRTSTSAYLFATARCGCAATLHSTSHAGWSDDLSIDAKVAECLHIASVFERATLPSPPASPRGLTGRKGPQPAVSAARSAQSAFAGLTAYNRGQILYRIAEVLGDRRIGLTVIVCDIFDPAWLLEIEAIAAA